MHFKKGNQVKLIWRTNRMKNWLIQDFGPVCDLDVFWQVAKTRLLDKFGVWHMHPKWNIFIKTGK